MTALLCFISYFAALALLLCCSIIRPIEMIRKARKNERLEPNGNT